MRKQHKKTGIAKIPVFYLYFSIIVAYFFKYNGTTSSLKALVT